jgi:hypothetical protein
MSIKLEEMAIDLTHNESTISLKYKGKLFNISPQNQNNIHDSVEISLYCGILL